MGRTTDLGDFLHGMIIGRHHSSKSVWEISTLLKIAQSIVSDVIVKWKPQGATVAQSRT